jgi:hypothetical protein
MYRISGIGVTRGWESLRNEVQSNEKPKVPKTKVSKKKNKKKPKVQSRTRDEITYLNQNIFCSCSYNSACAEFNGA